jgi:hypothetical protein
VVVEQIPLLVYQPNAELGVKKAKTINAALVIFFTSMKLPSKNPSFALKFGEFFYINL